MQERLFVEGGLVEELMDATEVCRRNFGHLVCIDGLSLCLLVDILMLSAARQGALAFATLISISTLREGLRSTRRLALMQLCFRMLVEHGEEILIGQRLIV